MRARLLLVWGALSVACREPGAPAGESAGSTGETAGATTTTTTTEPTTTEDAATGSEPTAPTSSSTGAPELCGEAVTPGPTIVRTTLGPIEGLGSAGGVAFLGLRYAAPPVGALRFRPPQAPACTPELTPATAIGPRCPQVRKDALGQVTASFTEEDCLTLNVWTPGADQAARPVLVFIHGGGNATGTGADELYDGAALAAAQDVVVVTLNYRLGALGFLTHPALAAGAEDAVSGNYGLLDQVLALQWVRDNVASFGGDPLRVLLLGESAGAVDVCALIGSPRAAGLFQRAIVQSGSCRERTLARYEGDIAAPWFAASGCADSADAAACLRALPVDEMLTVMPDGYPSVAGLVGGWGPHIDGVVLPKSTLASMAAGTHNHGPVIFGANAGETAMAVPAMTVAMYEALVTASFGPLAPQVLAQYPAAEYDDDGAAAYVALTTDLKFVCNARRSARAAAAGQDQAVYRYHFAYDAYNALPNTPKAAFHGLELVYLFANWDALLPGGLKYTPNADDLELSWRLQAAWARFAATGGPAGADLAWPVYVGVSDNAALLDEPPGLVQDIRAAQCDFWDGLLP